MMSCTTSAAWSHHVSSPYYTEYGQRCGAILSGRIITVAMSRSGHLSLCCTVEPNCSGMSACLTDALVTRGGSRAHLYRKVWSEDTAYVTVCECTLCSLS
jgi:hypothetical protein